MVNNGEVFEDTSIKVYKKLDEGKVIAYFEREATTLDKPAVIERGTIVQKPQYYGVWQDKTDEYNKAQEEKKAALKEARKQARLAEIQELDDKLDNLVDIVNTVSKQGRSGHARTKDEIREEELRRAQALLNKMLEDKSLEERYNKLKEGLSK